MRKAFHWPPKRCNLNEGTKLHGLPGEKEKKIKRKHRAPLGVHWDGGGVGGGGEGGLSADWRQVKAEWPNCPLLSCLSGPAILPPPSSSLRSPPHPPASPEPSARRFGGLLLIRRAHIRRRTKVEVGNRGTSHITSVLHQKVITSLEKKTVRAEL